MLTFFLEYAGGTVSGCRRGVKELHVLIQTPVEQDAGITVVVFHHVPTIGFHGVGTRAFVEDGFDITIEVTGLDTGNEILLVDVIGDIAINQILEFFSLGEIVDRNDLAHPAFIQGLDQIGADEAGRAGNDGVHPLSLQSASDFVAADDGGAEFAHHNTCRHVGDANGFCPFRTRRQHHRQGSNDSITGTGDVVHLPR